MIWDEIKAKCPNLYKKDIPFECGSGWANLILDLSLKIEEILKKNPQNFDMTAIQIKEKYGTLRFYMSGETEEIRDLIREAEADSSQVCENCGAPAKMRGTKWFEVKCDDCYMEIA